MDPFDSRDGRAAISRLNRELLRGMPHSPTYHAPLSTRVFTGLVVYCSTFNIHTKHVADSNGTGY